MLVSEVKLSTIAFLIPVFLAIGCERNYVAPQTTAPLIVAGNGNAAQIKDQTDAVNNAVKGMLIFEGSSLRTSSGSPLIMDSQVSPQRIALLEQSEIKIEKWRLGTQRPRIGAEEVRVKLSRGILLVDVPVLPVSSDFEVQGENFVAQVRSGSTVAAITAAGNVLVQSGTVVCVYLSPSVRAVMLGAGQMTTPASMAPQATPAASNQLWNAFSP